MTQPDQSTQAQRKNSSKIEKWLLSNGTLVDHFRIIRPLGKGGMAEVYLARDTKLGRKVALKIVKPETLGSKEAIERFLFEARATARFNHPHIVTIYAVGEDHSRPYVALEYLEGQSLRRRMDDQQLSQKEAVRIGLAIAEALREAHGGDILHRDLKPENVNLVKDGRLRGLDFGLAGVFRSEGRADNPENMKESVSLEPHSEKQAGIQGTPAYMAPEQWEEKEETGAVDIWALGVILYELVSSRRPYDESSSVKQAARVLGPYPVPALSDDIPAELANLIMECLHKQPGKRPSAARVVRGLSQLLAVDQEAEAIDESPFRGLLSFDERHRHFFFGRDSEIASFVERLRQQPVLLVVGPSGAGKSSFVQAGVIPRLRERGPLIVLQIRPGTDPFLVLASRIVSARRQAVKTTSSGPFGSGQPDNQGQTGIEDAIGEAERLTQQLRDSPHLLNLVLHRLAEQRQGNVVLFVDQLEELYTLVPDAATRRLFMQAICTAADDPEMPVRVIFTVREEFLSRLAEGVGVREVLSQIAVLRSPDKGSLREILSRPVEGVGFSYEDQSMVDEMVSDVEGEVSPLPLLQFAGRTLWDRRDNEQRALKRSVYKSMGGVAGALAQHADGVLAGMSAGELALARSLLLRLVTGEGTRQVLPRSRLVEGLERRAEDVLKRLTLARLITTKQSEIEEEAELELVHESLIATWGRLARWIDESREEIVFLAEVTQAAQLWEKRGRRAEEVWRGDALREARRAVEHCTTDVPSQIKRFLEAGHRKEHSQRLRRRGVVVVAFMALIVLALIFMAKERETGRQKEVAEHERAVAQREGATTALQQGDVLEARAKLRASMEALDSVSGRALWARLKKTPLIWKKELPEVIQKIALAPDGKTIAVAIFGGWIVLLDTATATTHMFRAYKEGYVQPYFSPDGETLAFSTEIGQIGLWNLETHKLRTLAAHSKPIIRLAYSPDGRYLASAGEDKTVRLWDVQSGAERKLGGKSESMTYVLAFDPQGKYLAAAGEGKQIRLWDLKSPDQAKTFEFETEYIHRLFFGPQGKQLFSVGKASTHIWDIASKTSRQLPAHKIPAFSSDGRLLVRRAEDGSLFVWDVEKETVHATLEESREKIYQAEFSKDKKLVVAAGADNITRVWQIPSGQKWMQFGGQNNKGTALLFTPDGRHLVTGGWEKTVRFWDLSSQTSQPVKRGPGDQVIGIDYSPDGTRLAVSWFDRVVRIWDSASGKELAAFEGHTATVWNLDYSPDGSQVATAAHDKTVRIWDVKNFSSSDHKVLK
ncbi:MAG: protein kinase, partial [Deltaproteobacteria bacterium]|nr:protein kinase [Deltaproteobacteria bacterium]